MARAGSSSSRNRAFWRI